ncbi:MAG: TraB/GumN family protein [Defluviitaleaceae bacterium]|nr:TraB/GumN family protein [Defluviitaleaceae bacterium]
MKKTKAIFAMLVAVLILVNSIVVYASISPLPTQPEIRTENGVDYFPIRQTANFYGWSVEWDGENQTVILTKNQTLQIVDLDVENQAVILIENQPTQIVHVVSVGASGGFNDNGRVYVPVDFLMNLLEIGAVEEEKEETNDDCCAVIPEGIGIHGKLTRIEYGDNVAYLFGSMHAGFEHWFPLHSAVEDAMARADVFAFEIDMVEMLREEPSPEVIEQILALQMLPDELTLEDILPEDVFENFYTNFQTFAHLGLTYEAVKNISPITLMVTLDFVMVNLLGADLSLSVDEYVVNFAEAAEKPIIGLNSILGELTIVHDIPLEIQGYALVNFPTFEQMLQTARDVGMADAYESQDIDGIRRLFIDMAALGDDNPYHELFFHNLLYVRCHIFADEIARLLQETEEPTTFFVTIGLGHIIGGGGGIVLYLLEDMGFDPIPLWN